MQQQKEKIKQNKNTEHFTDNNTVYYPQQSVDFALTQSAVLNFSLSCMFEYLQIIGIQREKFTAYGLPILRIFSLGLMLFVHTLILKYSARGLAAHMVPCLSIDQGLTPA